MKKVLVFFISIVCCILLLLFSISVRDWGYLYSKFSSWMLRNMICSFTESLTADELYNLSTNLNKLTEVNLYYTLDNEKVKDFNSYKILDNSKKNALLSALLRLSIRNEKLLYLKSYFLFYSMYSPTPEERTIYFKVSENSDIFSLTFKDKSFKFGCIKQTKGNILCDTFNCFFTNKLYESFSFYSAELNEVICAISSDYNKKVK